MPSSGQKSTHPNRSAADPLEDDFFDVPPPIRSFSDLMAEWHEVTQPSEAVGAEVDEEEWDDDEDEPDDAPQRVWTLSRILLLILTLLLIIGMLASSFEGIFFPTPLPPLPPPLPGGMI